METNASILLKGVKQRVYFGDTVYLANNTEFEIEFFNKSRRTVCPSITINGEKFRRSPVVYNGQRYILTDFMDVPKKLLFQVYEVDYNDTDAQNAIKDNGVISIKYYYEKVKLEEDSHISYDPRIVDESSRLLETGKIMKGSSSDKKYNMIEIDLEYSISESQIIKLLPISRKPKTMKCPKCENISSSDANYCANCGHSLE